MTTAMYSVPVAGSPDIPGEGKPRRSVLCPPELVQNYKTPKGTVVSTLYENFLEGVRIAGIHHLIVPALIFFF